MKRWMTNAAVMAIVAGVVVLGQWLMMRADDAFTLTRHQGQTYKVFSYGFPFTVVDCDAAVGLGMAGGEVYWRLIGNWAAVFVLGLTILKGIQIVRTGQFRVRRVPHAT